MFKHQSYSGNTSAFQVDAGEFDSPLVLLWINLFISIYNLENKMNGKRAIKKNSSNYPVKKSIRILKIKKEKLNKIEK